MQEITRRTGGFSFLLFLSLKSCFGFDGKKDCEILWWKNSFKDEMHELPLTHSHSLSLYICAKQEERERVQLAF